jgi:hypothetical protein
MPLESRDAPKGASVQGRIFFARQTRHKARLYLEISGGSSGLISSLKDFG